MLRWSLANSTTEWERQTGKYLALCNAEKVWVHWACEDRAKYFRQARPLTHLISILRSSNENFLSMDLIKARKSYRKTKNTTEFRKTWDWQGLGG